MRSLLVLFLLALGLAPLSQAHAQTGAQGQAMVTLRGAVSVEREFVQVGDIFAGLPKSVRADADVMRSPSPGQKLSLDAASLTSIAQNFGVKWAPANRSERVVIERASMTVGSERLRPAVGRALVERGLPPGADFAFDNDQMRIQLPIGSEAGVVVEQIQYDAAHGRFNATLLVGDESNAGDRIKVTGRVHQTAEAAVLTRPIQPGEVIRLSDIQIVRLRVDQVGAATVADPMKMIGRTVRRAISAGQPIRTSELAPVLFVTRNALITVKVDSPRMTLVMQAKSLDDGADGDTVRVVNTRSDKMVQGIVTGPGEVTVRSGYQIAAK